MTKEEVKLLAEKAYPLPEMSSCQDSEIYRALKAKVMDKREAFVLGFECCQSRQHSSLPSNLDDVKLDTEDITGCVQKAMAVHYFELGKQAGAEWMAGQFQKIEGDLVDWYSTSDGKDYCCGVKTDEAFEVPEGFYIRKK